MVKLTIRYGSSDIDEVMDAQLIHVMAEHRYGLTGMRIPPY